MNSNFKLLIIVLIISYLILPGIASASEKISFDEQFGYDHIQSRSNPMLSFAKSAIIPGWGEIGQGSNSGYAFLAAEFLLWAGRFYFAEEVNLREREAYVYALQNAGLQPGNYSDEHLYILTRYNHSGFGAGGYNEFIYRQAQAMDPDEREQYILDNAIFDDSLSWSWGSREQRRQYSIMRKNADHNRDYIKGVTGVIVANHIISAINAARITARNNRLQQLHFSIDYDHKRSLPLVNAEYRF
jgi:hypothetical protein